MEVILCRSVGVGGLAMYFGESKTVFVVVVVVVG